MSAQMVVVLLGISGILQATWFLWKWKHASVAKDASRGRRQFFATVGILLVIVPLALVLAS